MSLNELSERVNITQANMSILKTGKAKAIRISTLDAICRVLECQPGDIIEYRPGRTGPGVTGGGAPPRQTAVTRDEDNYT